MLPNKKEYCENLIRLLENSKLSVDILFITRNNNDDSYQVYKGNLSDEVSENLRNLCLKISKKSYSKPDKKDFAEYDATNKGSSCTEFLEGKQLDQIKPILQMFESKLIDLKDINKEFLDSLWFYVLRLSDGNTTTLFFKKYSKGMVLTKGAGLAIAFNYGDFDKLKQDIFLIYDKVDCILLDNENARVLIIRAKGNFEKIFNFMHLIKKNAEEAIKFVEEKLPFKIENFDGIKQTWMEHEIKIRKLNNIYATKTLEKINPENIQALINDGILKNVNVKKDKNGTLILSSNDPWEILNILDDDYVKSRLTGINYEATHKKEIGK